MRLAWSLVGAAALLLRVPCVVAGQGPGLEPLTDWIAEPGARANVQAGGITVARGTIRTARLYSDFVLRFEFRLPQPAAEARVLVRSRFGYGTSRSSERGYRITLTNRIDGVDALGRVSGADAKVKEITFTPPQPAGSEGGWQECEIRAERDQIAVRVNGRTVSVAESMDELTGHIALQARRGGEMEFRNVRVERLPSSGDPFGRGARRATEPGVVLPRTVKTSKPFYPQQPHDAWIQGVVGLEVVVETTGRAGDVRVVKSVHPDLDEAAIACVRQWQFVPGSTSGQPVPVIITMEISFRRTR